MKSRQIEVLVRVEILYLPTRGASQAPAFTEHGINIDGFAAVAVQVAA